MSHRLQVLLDEAEHEALKAAARRRGATVSQYVREVLREARSGEPVTSVEAKLAVVRKAAAHTYPTGDPDQIEREILAGILAVDDEE